MRPTLDYIIEKFDYYNQLCFDGKLERPPIMLNTRYSAMGQTDGQGQIDEKGKIHWTDLRIEISVRRDLPEYEYIDTLVHEMIHYYIMSNDLEDDSPHGTLFRQKMSEITNKYGIRITIDYDPSEEIQIATRTRNKLFEFWELIPQIEGVSDMHWYVSDRQIFENVPVAVSLALIPIDAGKIHHYLTGARELEKVGEIIREKK